MWVNMKATLIRVNAKLQLRLNFRCIFLNCQQHVGGATQLKTSNRGQELNCRAVGRSSSSFSCWLEIGPIVIFACAISRLSFRIERRGILDTNAVKFIKARVQQGVAAAVSFSVANFCYSIKRGTCQSCRVLKKIGQFTLTLHWMVSNSWQHLPHCLTCDCRQPFEPRSVAWCCHV